VQRCLTFSVIGSSGEDCTATDSGAFLTVSAEASLTASECSATLWVGSYNNVELGCGKAHDIDTLNTSFNSADMYGSALVLGDGGSVTCRLILAACNVPKNTLLFDTGIVNSEAVCLALVNNTCQHKLQGLVLTASNLTIRWSLFQAKTFNIFIVGWSTHHVVTFIGCVFDFAIFDLVNVTVTTLECALGATTGAVTGCLTRTPQVTKTPPKTGTMTAVPPRSAEATETATVHRFWHNGIPNRKEHPASIP
jgi:hypothetical protein